jgi:anti-sigma factor (TIGR02949 family)
MDCDDVYALLDAYVDRELDVAHDLAIAVHLQTCQRCAQQYEALLALQVALRTRGTYFASPPSLRQRLRTTLRRAAPAPFLRRSQAVLTAGGLLVLVLGGVFMWLHWSPPALADGLVREVVAAHVRSLQVDHLTDVASTDTHTLKPWLSDKLAFAPPVIDLAPHGFQLLGARLDYLHDRAVAAVVYRRRQHRINLWIAPAGPATATAAALATRHGYHVLHWVHAGMSYWAVSDLNQEELSLLKQLLQYP